MLLHNIYLKNNDGVLKHSESTKFLVDLILTSHWCDDFILWSPYGSGKATIISNKL